MPDFSACSLYIDCTNNSEMSVDQLFVALVKEDDNGCPALNIVTDAGGAPAGIATEVTLQAVLTAVNQHQDWEPRLVIDQGNGDQVVCQIIEYDEQTTTYSYIYKDVNGAPYVPTGPIKYINPEALLTLIQAELVALNTNDFATELTLDAIKDDIELGVAYSNSDISGVASTIIAANTVKSVELIVIEGVVTLDNIAFPVGTFPINAKMQGKITNALDFDASGSLEAYLQILT